MNAKFSKGLYFGKAKLLSTVFMLAGIFTALITFGGILTVAEKFDGFALFMVFAFLAVTVLLFRGSIKKRREVKRAKEYISIIANRGERELESIADIINRKYDDVKKDLQKLIDAGLFKNAYIDEKSKSIVIATKTTSPAKVEAEADQTMADATVADVVTVAPVETRIVTCSCCGANNTIAGDFGECEYCGAPIK